jgi:hypothetical protein
MNQPQRPLACKACDGLGVRIVPQGGHIATCQRCMGTGKEEVAGTAPNESSSLAWDFTPFYTGGPKSN